MLDTINIKNADSFTEFLFSKVVNLAKTGAIYSADPVYRFAMRFQQEIGWPIEADSKPVVQEYLVKTLYNQIFGYTPGELVGVLNGPKDENPDNDAFATIEAGLQTRAVIFQNRLRELLYTLDLAWKDYEAQQTGRVAPASKDGPPIEPLPKAQHPLLDEPEQIPTPTPAPTPAPTPEPTPAPEPSALD